MELNNYRGSKKKITMRELVKELETCTTHAEQIAINILKSREEAAKVAYEIEHNL